jgi:hypothetical protein
MNTVSTIRALLLIGAITIFSAWIVQDVEWVYNGPSIAGDVYPPSQVYVAIPLVGLALLLLLKRWIPANERALIYAGTVIGVTAGGSAIMHRFLPALVTGFYGSFANPKGQYYPLLELIPEWMVPSRPNGEAAILAFEGGGSVPWDAWIGPLLGWSVLFVALFLTSYCLSLLLRERWMETERLSFPLLEMPAALIEGTTDSGPLFKSRPFIWGAALPVVLFTINGVNHYFPELAKIGTALNLSHFLLDDPFKAMAAFESPFVFSFSPILVSIAYLSPVEVSFSTWVFYGVSRVLLLITELSGLTDYRGSFLPNAGSVWLDWPTHLPWLMPLSRGGVIALASYHLWSARRDLLKVMRPSNPSTWGFAIGILLMWGWTIAAGIPAHLGLIALLLYLLLTVGFIRMRLDGGLPVTTVYIILGYLIFLPIGTGPGVFSMNTYVGFSFLGVLGYTAVGMWPAMQFEGFKLGERFGVSIGRMGLGMWFGLAVGLSAGAYFCLETMYEYGLFPLREQGGAQVEARIGRYYNYLMHRAQMTTSEPDYERFAFHGIGAAVTFALVVLRQRFLRWPLHPMGFVYGMGFGWMVWGSALTGWVFKMLTVKYGGASTYRKVRPFFLGMIFGEVAMRVVWSMYAYGRGEMGMGYNMPFLTEF